MRWGKAVVAIATAAGLSAAPVALGAIPGAVAAPGAATGTVTLSCKIASFPAYNWTTTISVSAVRPANSTSTALTATLTEMDGTSPALLDYDIVQTLKLSIDGVAVSLAGEGHVKTTTTYQSFPLPDVSGMFNTAATTVAVNVGSFSFVMDPNGMKMGGVCTPTGAAQVGTMKIATGALPTPTVVPTSTSSATAKPRVPTSSSAAPTGAAAGGSGTPAKGNATFNCRLGPPFASSTFTYPTSISISGGRASKTSSTVVLGGKIESMPGIVPVPLDAVGMRVKLKGTIDGKSFELKGSNSLTLAIKEKIPVPAVSGEASTSATNPVVKITGFGFDTDEAGGISVVGTCTLGKAVTLSKMTVGIGKSAVQAAGTSTGTGSGATGGSSSTAGTLPKTGASDLGMLLAWGLGLVAIGSSGLVLVRRLR